MKLIYGLRTVFSMIRKLRDARGNSGNVLFARHACARIARCFSRAYIYSCSSIPSLDLLHCPVVIYMNCFVTLVSLLLIMLQHEVLFVVFLLFPSPKTLAISPQAANAGAAAVNAKSNVVSTGSTAGQPSTEGKTTFDGVSLAAIPEKLSTAEVVSKAMDQSTWSVTCDSQQAQYPCSNAIDGSNTTFWHSEYSPSLAALPHNIVVNMKSSYSVGRITYEPRQDGSSNGNIGEHTIQLSSDGKTWSNPVAVGTYIDDSSLKTTIFTPKNAQYVKLTALTEAGNRGPWTSIGNLNVYTSTTAVPLPNLGGSWGLTIDFPLVPVSGAIEYSTGNILVWSSYAASTFGGSNGQMTLTAMYDVSAQKVTSTSVSNTGHDMFCIGLSLDASGRAVSVGGNTDAATSIFDPASQGWTKGGVSLHTSYNRSQLLMGP